MIKELAQDLVELIFDWGYLGIFMLMTVESSFIPFPSEIILIPAGYLASEGKMNLYLIMASGLGGSMVGAFINYYLALFFGRNFLVKYGKYFFIKESALDKMDNYFNKHGAISTFTGRLIPGIRQLISIPAGLSKMHLGTFSFYTALGAGLWALILVLLGYYIGENKELIDIYLKQIIYIILTSLAILAFIYYKYQKSKG
ncbi:MAG: DedA family protein [Sulfurimonas sp.]|nr:DedA family protein [Sulfurimonas sp.]